MIPFATPRFGEPPHGRNRWDRIADELAQRPGQWAAIGTLNQKQGLPRSAVARYGIELIRRPNGDGTSTVWGRVGHTTATTPPAPGIVACYDDDLQIVVKAEAA